MNEGFQIIFDASDDLFLFSDNYKTIFYGAEKKLFLATCLYNNSIFYVGFYNMFE